MNHALHAATTRETSRIVRLSALYDLVVTSPFASPWTARATVALLGRAHAAFGLTGAPPDLDSPTPLLFATLMGSLVVVWSVVRIYAPSVLLLVADTAARVLFSAWMAYALVHGGSPVLSAFLVLEISWAVVQGRALSSAWVARDGVSRVAPR